MNEHRVLAPQIAPGDNVTGPASYFPSIEKRYGQPVQHWLDIAADHLDDLTHMEVVERLCDRVAVVHQGRIIAEGAIDDLRAGRRLEDVFVELVGAGETTAGTFYWPFGMAVIDGRFVVADTGNRRVLIWRDGVPAPGQPADVVLGQPSPSAREENRGGPVAADSFRWPHAIAGTGTGGLLVADAGNHRVLRWDRHPESDRPADGVLGQPDFANGTERVIHRNDHGSTADVVRHPNNSMELFVLDHIRVRRPSGQSHAFVSLDEV